MIRGLGEETSFTYSQTLNGQEVEITWLNFHISMD